MRLLVKLELHKFDIKKTLWGTIILWIGLCFFSTIAIFGSEQDGNNNYISVLRMVNAAVIDCFLIYAGILTTKVVVEEYTKRTILSLFTYSFRRINLILAKVFVILGITVVMALATELVCLGYLCAVDIRYDLIAGTLTLEDFTYWVCQLLISLFMLALFSLMPISVALIKKTNAYVFLSSLFMVLLVQMNVSQNTKLTKILISTVFGGSILCVVFFMSAKKCMNRLEG